MFYEERWIDGVLHYRTNPRDQFRPIEDMEKWVNDHFAAFREQNERLRTLLDAATPPEGAAQGREDAPVPLVVREYICARDAYEEATRPLNSHAMPRTLSHGSPITARFSKARAALAALAATSAREG
jgi:hypothetical protein